MEICQDFKELLELFNENKVEYLVVSGYALAFHGSPRYTGDLDLFVNPNRKNATRILKSLSQFGFGKLDITEDDFSYPDKIVQLGFPPVRIDIITSITNVTWDEAISNCIECKYGGIPVKVLGVKEFIKNKKSIGRNKDLFDIETIDE